MVRAAEPAPAVPSRVPWWRRWFGARGGAERSARRVWRRSLPLGYRIRRWLIGVVVVVLLGGGLSVIGRNPIGWLVDRYHDVRGTVEEVGPLNAATQPAPADGADQARAAIDRDPLTAWTTTARPAPTDGTCLPPDAIGDGTAGSLLVNLGRSRRVQTLLVYAGLPAADPNRLTGPRPRTLQIGYATGCLTLPVADTGDEQRLPADFTAEAVWITVTEVWPAASGDTTGPVALSEVGFLARP